MFNSMKRRVVITGLGVVAPNGIGKDEFWQGCIEGKSGVDLIMSFDTSKLSSKIAAQILDFDPLQWVPPKTTRRTDRFVHLGLASAGMALEDSGLCLDKEDRSRIGVCIGSGLGGILFHEEQIAFGFKKGLNKMHPLGIPQVSPNSVSSHIAMQYNFLGPNFTISNACASGTNAIGQAFRMIQNNDADIIVCGGVEAPITPFTYSAYCAMHVLSVRNDSPHEASRPFDKERDGFVMGEGGAILILEELSHAVRRDAHIYAEVIGYGTTQALIIWLCLSQRGKMLHR
jgi:3-oxoacyl-[acyl-carrier-protein] synthase II